MTHSGLQGVGRRRILGGLAALAGVMGAGCAATGRAGAPRAEGACLPTPDLSDAQVIDSIVGLRPYRRSGFVVRGEPLDNTLVVHNYGHGGGGITLSWGTSTLAVAIGAETGARQAAVIGAGAVGLTTARLAQEAGLAVTLYAAEPPERTTSAVAGGQWYPSMVYDRREPTNPAFMAQLDQASRIAHERFSRLDPARYGVRRIRNYELYSEPAPPGPPSDLWLHPLMEGVAELAPGDHPFGRSYVRQWDGMLVETPRFLRALFEDFIAAGGTFVGRSFRDRAEVAALEETLVFNCTGLGARALFGDEELQPRRGQLVRLKPQPHINYAVSTEDFLYMFARDDALLLGGTAERDSWDLTPSAETTGRLLAGHRRLFAQPHCFTV